jgi:hypothetical protein
MSSQAKRPLHALPNPEVIKSRPINQSDQSITRYRSCTNAASPGGKHIDQVAMFLSHD